MYQMKWNEVIPQILPKIIDRRLVRAWGSFFDCRFTLDFDDNSCIQFQCDDLIHRNAIEFEIILNRQKIYNPLHFDSTDVFTSNLGIIVDCIEYRTAKRNNVREIIVLFDAKKKFFGLSQFIQQSTKDNIYKLDGTVSETITEFLQPRNDKMTIRTYRKQWHDLKKYEPKGIKTVEQHQQLIDKLFPQHNAQNGQNEEMDINYDDSLYNLYPIQNTDNVSNGNRTGYENNDEYTQEAKKEIAKNLYPINQVDNENEENEQNGDIEMRQKYKNITDSELSGANASNVNLRKRDYDKIYCDVVCRISAWNTFTTTAKKKKY